MKNGDYQLKNTTTTRNKAKNLIRSAQDKDEVSEGRRRGEEELRAGSLYWGWVGWLKLKKC